MILDYCPRCDRKVVSQQVTKDYHYSYNHKTIKSIQQIICNICGVTVSLISKDPTLKNDLMAINILLLSGF